MKQKLGASHKAADMASITIILIPGYVMTLIYIGYIITQLSNPIVGIATALDNETEFSVNISSFIEPERTPFIQYCMTRWKTSEGSNSTLGNDPTFSVCTRSYERFVITEYWRKLVAAVVWVGYSTIAYYISQSAVKGGVNVVAQINSVSALVDVITIS